MFAKKTNEPIEFEGHIEIAATCGDVFEALNLRSLQNRYLQRGMSVTPVDGTTDQFHMVNPMMPNLTFTMTELRADPAQRYDLVTAFPEGHVIGILTGDESSYRLSPNDEGGTHVHYVGAFHTIRLSKKRREEESDMLIISVNDDLARLKVLLEESPQAADKAGALDELFDTLEQAC